MAAVTARGKEHQRTSSALYIVGSFPSTCEFYKHVDEGRAGGSVVTSNVSILGPLAVSFRDNMTGHDVMIRM